MVFFRILLNEAEIYLLDALLPKIRVRFNILVKRVVLTTKGQYGSKVCRGMRTHISIYVVRIQSKRIQYPIGCLQVHIYSDPRLLPIE